MSSLKQPGTGPLPAQHQRAEQTQPPQQQQQQALLPLQSVYGSIPLIGSSFPLYPVTYHHPFGALANPSFYISSQSSYVVGTGMGHVPTSSPAALQNVHMPTPYVAIEGSNHPLVVPRTNGQQQEQETQGENKKTARGIQSAYSQEEATTSRDDDIHRNATGHNSTPPLPPSNRHIQSSTEPPEHQASLNIPRCATSTAGRRSTASLSTKLLETILHVDKPLANISNLHPHRTLISADPHWHCMLEESMAYISYQPPSAISNESIQEEAIRTPMRRLCLRLQFCPDPHMTEFRDHALQFTTLQIVGYGSQQVEVTQRISGYDLVNRGVKVYIDHHQVLYNNKSSYGFSIVLSNQPMSQLSTPPRPPTNISMLLPSATMDDDPSLGGSLEVQLTSAYCRRNLAEMLRDTATTDTVIYVMNPCCSANSTSSTTSKTESSPTTTSSIPQQQSPLHHAAPQQRFMQRPEHQQQVLASNINQHQQQHTENPQHHPLQHRHDVPQAQAHLTLPPTSAPNQSQGISQVQQTIATAPGRNEHVTQSAPPESLQGEAARSEQQRSPDNSNSPTPLARPLTTPPPHDRSVSPTPSETMAWSHYHSRQYAQHVQPHHPRHAIFAQRQYHSPSWPHPPHMTILQAQSTQPLDQPHSNLEHETAPQALQHKQPTPEQLLQKSSHQLTSEISMEFRAHYVVLKNYSMINRMIQRAASEQQRLRYVMCIRLQNPHLMRVLLEYLYTHQITAPTLLNSETPSSSSPSPSAPTRPSSPSPTLRQYTYTWREVYELAEQFGLHTLARMVKCALIAELTPDTVQEQLLEWVFLYPSLFPAYVKYAVDHRVDLLNSLQDMQIEAEVDDDIHNLPNIAGADENRNQSSGSRRTGGSNTDQWRRERTRRTAAAETYFRHTPSSSTVPGTSVGSAENDATSRAASSSLVWSHPKYRNVVARYTMFLDGIFALPTGFESKC